MQVKVKVTAIVATNPTSPAFGAMELWIPSLNPEGSPNNEPIDIDIVGIPLAKRFVPVHDGSIRT